MAQQQTIVGSEALQEILQDLKSDQMDVALQATISLAAKLEGLLTYLGNLGEAKAVSLDAENGYMVCGQPLMTIADSAPDTAPLAKGCFWYDTTNKALYVSKSVTGSTSDWGVVS